VTAWDWYVNGLSLKIPTQFSYIRGFPGSERILCKPFINGFLWFPNPENIIKDCYFIFNNCLDLWRVTLETKSRSYFVVLQSVIFWNAWILFKLYYLANPLSLIPYVHIDLRSVSIYPIQSLSRWQRHISIVTKSN